MGDFTIARSAKRLRFVVLGGIALILVVYAIGTLGPQVGAIRVETDPDVDGWQGQLVVGLSLLLFVVALARLSQMLSAIADGALFGPKVTIAFRGFAFWLFVATLVDVLAVPALQIADRISAGGGRAVLTFELRDILLLVGTLFLFLLARMLEQARAIQAELEEIV